MAAGRKSAPSIPASFTKSAKVGVVPEAITTAFVPPVYSKAAAASIQIPSIFLSMERTQVVFTISSRLAAPMVMPKSE